jgi:hypothetical protein
VRSARRRGSFGAARRQRRCGHLEPREGFIGALVFATIGAAVVRLVLRAPEGGNRR